MKHGDEQRNSAPLPNKVTRPNDQILQVSRIQGAQIHAPGRHTNSTDAANTAIQRIAGQICMGCLLAAGHFCRAP